MRVLVVDDDVSVQRRCREILEAEGFEVSCEASLGSTRRFLRNEGTDALVLDLFLPDGSGYELFRTSSELMEGLPVVGMTSVYRGSANARLMTLRYPFQGVVQKPVGVAALVEALRNVFGESYPQAPAWARADDQLVSDDAGALEEELDAIDQILSSQEVDSERRRSPTTSSFNYDAAGEAPFTGGFVSPLDAARAPGGTREAAAAWEPLADEDPLAGFAIADVKADEPEAHREEPERVEATVVSAPPVAPAPDDTEESTVRGLNVASLAGLRRPLRRPQQRPSAPPAPAAIPPQLDPDRVELQGRLEATPFPSVLAKIARHGETGTLLLRREQVKKIVYCEGGVPLAVKSNLVYECLGQVLVRGELISEQACELSVERLKAEGRPQGQILVEMGVLSDDALELALEKQLGLKIFDVFGWGVGLYQFRRTAVSEPVGYAAPRNPFALILAGMRESFPADRMSFDLSVYQAASPRLLVSEQELATVGLTELEMGWVRQMDGRTLNQLVAGEQERLRLVYTLACLGMLGFASF